MKLYIYYSELFKLNLFQKERLFKVYRISKAIQTLNKAGLGFIIISIALTIGWNSKGTVKKEKLILSEKKILKAVLSSGPFIKKIKLEKQKNLSFLLEQKYSFSNWSTFSNWTRTKKKSPQIFVFENKEDETKTWSFGLEKNIPYGLNLKSSYFYLDEKKTPSTSLKSFEIPTQIYRKNFSLELKAGLKEGLIQYWTLSAVKEGQKINDWLYQEKLEELALNSLAQYWKTYLSWAIYIQTKEGLKTYRRLVQQINNKKQFQFLNPGERPQILAEYENLKQKVDKQEQNYEREKRALLLILAKNSDKYEIQFKEEQASPLKSFPKINIENTRPVKIKDKQIKEQGLKLKSHTSQMFPNIQISGKTGWIPASSSMEDLSFSSKYNFHEMGARLSWVIFSKSFYEKSRQEKYKLEENKLDREILVQELKNKTISLEKEVPISYKNISQAKKANNYQKKAFRELKKSFDQGRVDVFELINIENKLRESEIKKITTLSEYSMLRLQLMALRDELVEKY